MSELLLLMDACNIQALVNLDGRWGPELTANLDRYDRQHPGRFATFCHVDWGALTETNPGVRLEADLRRSVAAGARGLKVWKDLGLYVRDGRGELVLPDDARLAPLWEQAGQLGIPVVVHIADPAAFFLPVDESNERLEELLAHPEWSFADSRYPPFHRLMDSLEAMIAGHPGTVFIGAHVGCYAENLAWVTRMLDTYPILYIDIAARLAELGRQPRRARQLLIRHHDRVLFGTDQKAPQRSYYELCFRFLETDDECFSYSTWEPPPTGRWRISALDLPSSVLEHVYAGNIRRLIPGLGAG